MEIVAPRSILYRENVDDAIELIAPRRNVKRILVVSDKVISSTRHFSETIEELKKSGFSIRVIDWVSPEPSFEEAKQIAKEAVAFQADLFLAIGGGSVIDAAKGGYILYENPDVVLEELNPFEPLGLGEKALLVAAPTTCGTGSDASFGLVLSKIENGVKRKYALGHPEIVPYASILDTEFLETLPRDLLRNTALDALSHAVEAYVATTANDYTDALAERVVRIIMEELPRALKERGKEALSRLHLAATMAGIAFTNAGLGLAHAIAHALGPLLGLHHGLTVALVLPYVVKFNSQNSRDAKSKYSMLSRLIGKENGFDRVLVDFYKLVGHPTKISKVVSVEKDKWEDIARKTARRALEDTTLAFNPVAVDEDEIVRILLEMY